MKLPHINIHDEACMTEHSMMERNSVLIDTDALYSSNIISKYVVFDCTAHVTHKYLTRDKIVPLEHTQRVYLNSLFIFYFNF